MIWTLMNHWRYLWNFVKFIVNCKQSLNGWNLLIALVIQNTRHTWDIRLFRFHLMRYIQKKINLRAGLMNGQHRAMAAVSKIEAISIRMKVFFMKNIEELYDYETKEQPPQSSILWKEVSVIIYVPKQNVFDANTVRDLRECSRADFEEARKVKLSDEKECMVNLLSEWKQKPENWDFDKNKWLGFDKLCPPTYAQTIVDMFQTLLSQQPFFEIITEQEKRREDIDEILENPTLVSRIANSWFRN